MMKFLQPLRFQVGEHVAVCTGREPFKAGDEETEKAMLSIGVFEKLPSGLLRYRGKVSAMGKDGKEHSVDADGFIDLTRSGFAKNLGKSFA